MYDELIDKLEDLVCDRIKDTDDAMLVCDAINAINALNKPRWIPVTERLPEDDDKRFLVCAKRFDGEPYIHICYHAKNLHEFDEYDFPTENRPGWYFYDSEYGWIEKEDVTHWMPLPQPPKEE